MFLKLSGLAKTIHINFIEEFDWENILGKVYNA